MSRKNKTVSFNIADPYDLELFNHAEKINPLNGKIQNFSKYVKKLIEEDIKRGQPGYNQSGFTVIDSPKYDEEENYTVEVKNAMNSFL